MKSTFYALLLTALTLPASAFAVEGVEPIRVAVKDGQLNGRVFTLLSDQETPLVGKVSLTNQDGKMVSTSTTDKSGEFSFDSIKPGKYMAVGIAGDYVGNTIIEVAVADEDSAEEGFYTALPLPVAQAPQHGSGLFDAYASCSSCTPASSFSQGPIFSGGSGGGCSTCGGGVGLRRFGSGGGSNFRRLALLGAAVAIPVALSGGDDDAASPDGA